MGSPPRARLGTVRIDLMLVLLAVTARALGADAPDSPLTVTGRADARLASFDRLMTRFVAENRLPGAALAVARHGRLVYARGFGYADLDAHTPVRPRSLFRIASVSKPITAVAVLQLVERGKLGLDDPVVALLEVRQGGARVEPGDPRLRRVTVRHLLQHRGGWDRDASFDPMFRPIRIAREFGAEPPAGPALIIASMWKRPLDFDPGVRYAYSNFGYSVLGRVIEKVSGSSYEEYVREQVLAPVGVRAMRIGKTLPTGRAPREVRYYVGGTKSKLGRGVIGPTLGERVSLPYGAWYLEAMDAHGGWIASAPDLVRFASALGSPPRTGTLLRTPTVRTLFAPPEGPAGHAADGRPKRVYYACGWQVRTLAEGARNTWHSGYLDGSTSLLVRRYDGLDWAVLFNSDSTPDGRSPADKIDPLVHQAADAVEQWPDAINEGGLTGRAID